MGDTAGQRRRHERASPLVDQFAIIDEIAIGYVTAGKRHLSSLIWEEQLVVWDRWWAKQTAKKPDPAFYQVFEVDINHSRLLAGSARTVNGKKLIERDRRRHPR